MDIFKRSSQIGLDLGGISMYFRVSSKGQGTEFGIFLVAKILRRKKNESFPPPLVDQYLCP